MSQSGTKRRWLIAAAGAATVLAVVLSLFRLPVVVAQPLPKPARPAVVLAPGHADELAMRDLTPLFLPTRYSAAASQSGAREPGSGFVDRDALRLKFAEDNPALPPPPSVPVPANPTEALRVMPVPLAYGFGRTDADLPAQAPRGAMVDVFASDDIKSDGPVLSVLVPVEDRPPGVTGKLPGWQPMEFQAAIESTGLVGALILTRGSGVQEVDAHFKNFLAEAFRLGDRLPPGFYRIVVGP
ncbi:hypothetical protein [Opitutus sp. ER46]|uniref:hypothetical protein n=1 Tax=Opitutus sp. ER46 TaxID=2161864 RepID=UPI000D30BF58|nr:hypothetical protein [Opitutus sp. ER46]PTX92399.1 hypothetical protein DB354_13760 [Opitutus sp. ER46]